MTPALVLPLVMVIICTITLYGCYRTFDRLQSRAEGSTGRRRWTAIGLAGAVGLVALLTFWCCFVFSAALLQALGANL